MSTIKEIKDLKQKIILLNCNISSEKLARAPRLWKEMKEENENLKKRNNELEVALKEKQEFIGINRLKMAFDEIKKLETQVGVLKRMNKRLRKQLTDT